MSSKHASHHKRGSRTSSTTHSKEDALEDIEFERMFRATDDLKPYYGEQAEFLMLILGRLGMRRGEVAHMREDWIDWRKKSIIIPYQQDCHKARDGNGICGACRQLAGQRAETRNSNMIDDWYRGLQDDDRIEPGHDVQPSEFYTSGDFEDRMWVAKTDAAAREVYFGFSARIELYIESFFDKYDAWPLSAQAINRRVNRVAEHTDGMTKEDVRPHSLRATAATHNAGRGLDMEGLMQHFGWANYTTARVYLARNPKNTARQLDSIHHN